MTFQEFSHYSERLKAEKAQKLRKRITIGVSVTIVLVILVASGVFVFVSTSKHAENGNGNGNGNANANQKQEHKAEGATMAVSHIQDGIKMVCGHTDYPKTCESNLGNALNSNYSGHPMDILKASITVISDEMDKIMDHTTKVTVDDPKTKAAIDDCKDLFADAKEELGKSVSKIGSGDETWKKHDLNSWLSAVMTYQQTCINFFPNGTLRTALESNITLTKELTSNALAIVSETSSILSQLKVPGLTHRRLLATEPSTPSLDSDGFPSWMTHEDGRMLDEDGPQLNPNVTVAQDGSGDFKTVSDALAAMPKEYKGRYVIFVKAGVYDETVTVTKQMENITMYGEGQQKTIVTGSKNFVDGVRTIHTATFSALGDGFMAKEMGFRNTAGSAKRQAVALRVQSDRSIFLNCRIEGYQDALYTQAHRQFYRACVISGTVDIIFGDAAVIFQSCLIITRKPLDNQQNCVTAQGRVDKRQTTGIVLHISRIMPDDDLAPVKAQIKSYLGRPWKEYSRTIVMETTIEDHIDPAGWLPWQGDSDLKTLYFAEFNNKGPGADTTNRVKWPGFKVINKEEAMNFTVEPFLQGDWITSTGTPLRIGLLP